MQLMPVILGMIPGLFLGVRVLLAVDANVAKIIAGLVLMGVGGVALLAPKLQLQSRLTTLGICCIAPKSRSKATIGVNFAVQWAAVGQESIESGRKGRWSSVAARRNSA